MRLAMVGNSIRAFIAVDIPEFEGFDTIIHDLKGSGNKIKFVSAEQCHITLKFLGDVSMDNIADVKGFMTRAIEGISPFDITLRGMGVFPNMRRPRVIWIGVDDPTHGLKTIAERLDSFAVEIGIKREKRGFTPHLTIGRVKFTNNPGAIARVVEAHRNQLFATVHVEDIRLKKSTLTPDGPIYEDIHIEKLK